MYLPDDAYRPSTPDITNDVGNRSASNYVAVAAQFQVEQTPRYQPRDGHTFCNIYVWDVTCAMGAEIPHWIKLDGTQSKMGDGVELSANAVVDWLAAHGSANGWTQCPEADARDYATAGLPTVAVWKNPLPGHSGHVVMILPGSGPTMIAQAGAHNHFNVPIAEGFGSISPIFYWHP